VNFWEALGIAPTEDKKVIKRAYTQALKRIDVEKSPAEFIALREAYELALEFSESSEGDTFEFEAPTPPDLGTDFSSEPPSTPFVLPLVDDFQLDSASHSEFEPFRPQSFDEIEFQLPPQRTEKQVNVRQLSKAVIDSFLHTLENEIEDEKIIEAYHSHLSSTLMLYPEERILFESSIATHLLDQDEITLPALFTAYFLEKSEHYNDVSVPLEEDVLRSLLEEKLRSSDNLTLFLNILKNRVKTHLFTLGHLKQILFYEIRPDRAQKLAQETRLDFHLRWAICEFESKKGPLSSNAFSANPHFQKWMDRLHITPLQDSHFCYFWAGPILWYLFRSPLDKPDPFLLVVSPFLGIFSVWGLDWAYNFFHFKRLFDGKTCCDISNHERAVGMMWTLATLSCAASYLLWHVGKEAFSDFSNGFMVLPILYLFFKTRRSEILAELILGGLILIYFISSLDQIHLRNYYFALLGAKPLVLIYRWFEQPIHRVLQMFKTVSKRIQRSKIPHS
jgi:hypothetical protein